MEMTVYTSKPYKILIEKGCLQKAGALCRELFPRSKRTVVVSDSNVFPLYGEGLLLSLKEAGFAADSFTFPAGEENKQLSTFENILLFLAEKHLTRTDFIIALGGGVTGDMAGFAAACYLRGIPFVQIPTTLLAQVDSSVGGKTAVDLPQGKNLVGAFHQPSLVLIDPDTLSTLPPQWFADGMGEVIKYGCIRSEELFNLLEEGDVSQNMEDILFRCVDIKRRVVEHDEFDTGERMLLNFGHTLGHALEKLHGFSGLSHGAAVGIGMVMITKAGERAGLTAPGTADRITQVLELYHLPVSDKADLGIRWRPLLLTKRVQVPPSESFFCGI